MTYRCYVCATNWQPYQTEGGVCVECGGGTRRVLEPASPGTDERYQVACAARRDRENHEAFDRYYTQREQALVLAQQTHLEMIGRLPTRDPKTRAA